MKINNTKFYAIAFSLILSFSSVALSSSASPSMWQNSLVVNSRFESDQGAVLNIMGYGKNRGDILMEINQSSHKLSSISGSIDNIDVRTYRFLKRKLRKNAPEYRKVVLKQAKHPRTGKMTYSVEFDLSHLKTSFDTATLRSIKNSDEIKLSLDHLRGNSGKEFLGLMIHINRPQKRSRSVLLYPMSLI